jgi:hypothetical protein
LVPLIAGALFAVTLGPAVAAAYSDAELLALEITGELLPPADLVEQVEADLEAVRMHNPYFAPFHVFPDWVPGWLLVDLTPEAWESFQAGEYHGWDELNELYDVEVTSESYPYTRTVRLAFTRPYHPDALAAIYHGTPGIEAAYSATQSDGAYDIFADVPAPGVYTGVYSFEESWIECGPGGCFFRHHTWAFQVNADGVTLIDESGPPLAVEPSSWGTIKSLFRDRR